MAVRVVLTGDKKLMKALRKFGKDGVKAIENTVQFTAQTGAENAKLGAPVNNGELRKGIKYKKISPLSSKYESTEPYSAYVEFGTGKKVSVPPEFSDMAAQFRGGKGGSFKDGLKAIEAWAVRKGIGKEAAWPIFMSILRNGITPQPFMYPAFLISRKNFKKDLKEEIKVLTDKFNR